MNLARFRIASVTTTAVAALLLASTANAHSTRFSAPVKRGGSTVGTATGTLVVGSNGWAIVGVRVTAYRAPSAGRSWRARTTMATSCTDPGFDPSTDDVDDFHPVAVNVASPWRTTRIAGTTGTLTTTDFVKQCPTGQVPGSSLMLRLAIQDSSGTSTAGAAVLFAAG